RHRRRAAVADAQARSRRARPVLAVGQSQQGRDRCAGADQCRRPARGSGGIAVGAGGALMSLDAALQTFLVESRELLEQMEYDLLQLESAPEDGELLNALFRSVHTVKGAAGIFGLQPIVDFTHVVENLLDQLRQRKLDLDADLAALLLQCRDYILELVELCPTSLDDLNEAQQAAGARLLDALEDYLPEGGGETMPVAATERTEVE